MRTKKKSERLQFSTQKQTSARMCWNCFHWNKRLALQHNLTHLKNLLKYGDTMGYAVCTILKSYFHKVSFSRDVFCLVLLQVPKCFGLVQVFCARPKIYLHIVAVTNILCQTKKWFEFSKIGFWASKKVFEEANFWAGSKYLDQHKTFWDL